MFQYTLKLESSSDSQKGFEEDLTGECFESSSYDTDVLSFDPTVHDWNVSCRATARQAAKISVGSVEAAY
jgi:hypothetical protein